MDDDMQRQIKAIKEEAAKRKAEFDSRARARKEAEEKEAVRQKEKVDQDTANRIRSLGEQKAAEAKREAEGAAGSL